MMRKPILNPTWRSVFLFRSHFFSALKAMEPQQQA